MDIKNLSIIMILLATVSCTKEPKTASISGTIKNLADNTKIVLAEASGKKIDSTYTKNGDFFIEYPLEDIPETYSLSFKNDKFWHYTKLFISNEKITISGDTQQKDEGFEVKGSVHNPYQVSLNNALKESSKQRNQIRNEVMNLRSQGNWNDSTSTIIQNKMKAITTYDKKTIKEFIKNNLDSYYAIYTLMVNKNDFTKDELKTFYSNIVEKKKNSKYGKVLKTYLEFPELSTGDSFFDFEAINQKDKIATFSEMFELGNQYVLLEFSSNHCPSSQNAIPMLNELNKNNSNKLQIVSFSTDKEISDFKSYTDKIEHIGIWDGKGTFSETYTKYKVDGTPTYFLFSPQGKLNDQWFGYGEGTKKRILNKISVKNN